MIRGLSPAWVWEFLSSPLWSRPALGPTQLPIHWVPAALSVGLKWLGHEADHSPPSSAHIKECVELYFHSCMAWCSDKVQGHLYIYLYLTVCSEQKQVVREVEVGETLAYEERFFFFIHIHCLLSGGSSRAHFVCRWCCINCLQNYNLMRE